MKEASMARYILYLCVVLLVGCATFEASQRMELFDDTSLAYEKALRFGDYRLANKFTRKEGAGQQDPDFNHLKNIRVTSYELLESTSSPDNLKVELTVEIRYFHADYLVVKTLIDEQRWEYDATEKCWHLHSALPDFK
jgi:hypothetical protein